MSDRSLPTPEPGYVRQARYLGHDAAMAAASWLEMSECDAASILDDCDPAVLDNYEPPNLSGEWADSETPTSLARDVLGPHATATDDEADAIADAWCEAVDAAWSDALQAHALRVVGRIDDACRVESELERRATELRELAK
jgi:hypothetical protein